MSVRLARGLRPRNLIFIFRQSAHRLRATHQSVTNRAEEAIIGIFQHRTFDEDKVKKYSASYMAFSTV
jgi:hypothetical protein